MKSLCGKAVHGWGMISDGDRIAVGLSGGKDSLSLLWLLAERRRRIPIDFGITALHVEMGFGTVDTQALRAFCEQLGVKLLVRPTDYGPRAHTEENRENSPCFFCALNRRRELFLMSDQAGCGKLALAHHQDDILETFMLNLLHAGSLSTMLPVQPFFQGRLVVIRPLSLINAAQTAAFCRQMGFPLQPPCCPSASQGERSRVRETLEAYYRGNDKVRPSVWHALTGSGLPTLPCAPSTQRHRRRKSKKRG